VQALWRTLAIGTTVCKINNAGKYFVQVVQYKGCILLANYEAFKRKRRHEKKIAKSKT